jgi:hypothetical protein
MLRKLRVYTIYGGTMNIFISLLTFLFIPTSTFATPSRDAGDKLKPYVLYFEGQLDIEAKEFSRIADTAFADVDLNKVIRERYKRNVTGSNIYTLAAFIEPLSEEHRSYFDEYVATHPEFLIGNTKISLRPADHIIEFLSINVFGPDEKGNEVSWGAFTNLRKFPNVNTYNNSMVDAGFILSGGEVDQIRKLLSSLLTPSDVVLFNKYLDGIGPKKSKLSRFTWVSRTFFSMQDGSTVNRALYHTVDRKLDGEL